MRPDAPSRDKDDEGDGDPEFGFVDDMARSLMQRGVDRALDRWLGRRLADQPLDDGAGRIDRDAAYIGSLPRSWSPRSFLGVGELVGRAGLELFALLLASAASLLHSRRGAWALARASASAFS